MKNPIGQVYNENNAKKKKKCPIISDNFGLRRPIFQKPFQTKGVTSIVPRVGSHLGSMPCQTAISTLKGDKHITLYYGGRIPVRSKPAVFSCILVPDTQQHIGMI